MSLPTTSPRGERRLAVRAAVGQRSDLAVVAAEEHHRFVADGARERRCAKLGRGRGRVPLIAKEWAPWVALPHAQLCRDVSPIADERREGIPLQEGRSTATTRPRSIASESLPCLSASAFSPNSSRRQPCRAGTSACVVGGDAVEVVDGGDHLGGDAVALGGHAQQDLEQLDGGLAVDRGSCAARAAAASWGRGRGRA